MERFIKIIVLTISTPSKHVIIFQQHQDAYLITENHPTCHGSYMHVGFSSSQDQFMILTCNICAFSHVVVNSVRTVCVLVQSVNVNHVSLCACVLESLSFNKYVLFNYSRFH